MVKAFGDASYVVAALVVVALVVTIVHRYRAMRAEQARDGCPGRRCEASGRRTPDVGRADRPATGVARRAVLRGRATPGAIGSPSAATAARDGAKPSDLLALSLAACLSYDVVEVLRKKRQDLHTLEVVVHLGAGGRRAVAVRPQSRCASRSVGAVDPAAARRALELAEKNCPVLATIAPTVRVETSIEVTSSS